MRITSESSRNVWSHLSNIQEPVSCQSCPLCGHTLGGGFALVIRLLAEDTEINPPRITQWRLEHVVRPLSPTSAILLEFDEDSLSP